MRHASRTDTARTVLASPYPKVLLGCLRCPRRVAFDPAKLPDPDRPVYQWRYRCECGSRDVEIFLAEAAECEARFFAGETPQRAGGHSSEAIA